MDLAKDVVDKYSMEQIIAYLDSRLAGVLQNYEKAVKKEQPQILFINKGEIDHIKSIIHEIRKRNDAREAMREGVI